MQSWQLYWLEVIGCTDPNIVGPTAKPSIKSEVASTITSTSTWNSTAVTLEAALKTEDANVVESTCKAMDMVIAHFRH